MVGAESSHESAPLGPVQQLFGPPGGQFATLSMFGWQAWTPSRSVPHVADALQFGPPSVARITYVFDFAESDESSWVSQGACSVAAVGVPPFADRKSTRLN